MQNQRKSLASSGKIMVLSLAAVALLAPTGALGAARPAKEGELFPHMDAAMGFLKAAQGQLQNGEPEFAGHREKAIQHVNAAIADLQRGIDGFLSAHPDAVRNENIPEVAPPPGAKFPHMESALAALQKAKMHLDEAAPQYNGKRLEGIAETRAAIAEVQAGLRAAHR